MALKVDPGVPTFFDKWNIPIEDPQEICKGDKPQLLRYNVIQITLWSGAVKIAIFGYANNTWSWMLTRAIEESDLFVTYPLSEKCVTFDVTKLGIDRSPVSKDRVVKKIQLIAADFRSWGTAIIGNPSIPPVEDPFGICKDKPLSHAVIEITLSSGTTKTAVFLSFVNRFPWVLTHDIKKEDMFRSFPLSKECVLYNGQPVLEDNVVRKIRVVAANVQAWETARPS